jgi:hypothetical protein
MSKVFIVLISVLDLLSCSNSKNDKDDERLFIKSIQTSSIKLDWFYYSYIGNVSRDYLIISNYKVWDTICICDNIYDAYVIDSNKVHIIFLDHLSSMESLLN